MSTDFLYTFDNVDGGDQFITTKTDKRSQEEAKSSQIQWLPGVPLW